MSNPFPEGTYRVELTDPRLEVASTGTPAFSTLARIIGRYDAKGQLQPCPAGIAVYRQPLANEVGFTLLKAALKAIGVEVTDLARLHPDAPDHVSLVGRQIDMVCELEPFQGKLVERWSIARPRLSLDAAQALQKQFGHLLQNGNGSSEPTPEGAVADPAGQPA